MDDKEMKEILYRLDERTEMMTEQVEVQNERIVEQRNRIDEVEEKTQNNRMILSGMTFGLSTIIGTAIGKMVGLINF